MALSIIGIVGVVVGVLLLVGVFIYALYVFWYVPRRQKRLDLATYGSTTTTTISTDPKSKISKHHK